MKHTLPAAATMLTLSMLPAQVVTASVSANTPLTATTWIGSQVNQSSVPAGPLSLGAAVQQYTIDVANAAASWSGGADPQLASVQIRHDVSVNATQPPSAAACSTDIVVEFNASSPCPVTLEFARQSATSAGGAWPTVQIDFGNDGSIDVANLVLEGVATAVADFGTQPLRARIVMSTIVVGAGFANTIVDVRVRPDNELSSIPTAVGCGSAPHALQVRPIFVDRGVRLDVPTLTNGTTLLPTVLVAGANAQPQLLPPYQGLPCLLVPSLDVLLLAPAQGLSVSVPLPIVVRPLQFHVQAVILSPSGLMTTDAFLVAAR